MPRFHGIFQQFLVGHSGRVFVFLLHWEAVQSMFLEILTCATVSTHLHEFDLHQRVCQTRDRGPPSAADTIAMHPPHMYTDTTNPTGKGECVDRRDQERKAATGKEIGRKKQRERERESESGEVMPIRD